MKVILLSLVFCLAAQADDTVLGTFQLNELFGASWPDQPIEFRYDGGQPSLATTRMMGPLNAEVPYQWVSSCSDKTATLGCIVVRSSLPPNANYTWTLVSGTAPSATQTNPVTLNMNNGNNQIEVTNGLTGIRIPASLPVSITLPVALVSPVQAPIQGIQLPDGNWTGVGASPNFLYAQAAAFIGNVGEPLNSALPVAHGVPAIEGSAIEGSATGYTVTVVDQGPLKTVVTATYTFNRPQYLIPPGGGSPGVIINNAGTGHYTFTATLYANSKSVLIDEDTDMEFSYFVPVYAQLQPDTARWRGANALDNNGHPNPICGYESPLTVSSVTAGNPIVVTISAPGSLSNGQVVGISGVAGIPGANGTFYASTAGFPANQFALYSDSNLTMPVPGAGVYLGGGTVKPVYRGQGVVPETDALQDLSFNIDRPASYNCSAATYRKILSDYPAGALAAGWYVEMYQSGGRTNDPVIGFYIGRASKQVYSATGPSLPGLYSSNSHFITHAMDAGIQVDSLVRSANGSTVCPVALPCGDPPNTDAVIHRNWGIFASTQADLLSLSSHQPIADEQNMLTGINLSHLYTYQLLYPDPPGGWQWLYLSAPAAATLESWVQNGNLAPCTKPSLACYATLLTQSEGSASGKSLVALWQGNSTAAVQTALDAATSIAQKLMLALSAGDNHFDASLAYYQLGLATSPETAVLNAILMNLNTTPAQGTLAKAELALFGSIFWDDDWFPIDNQTGETVGLANQVQQYLEYRTQSAFADPSQPFLSQQLPTAAAYSTSDFDAYFSSTGAAAGSTHYQSAFFEPLILNYMNPATQNLLPLSDPKWAAYANWELSIQTPPEPRFGNVRKGYSNGDGNTEGDVRTGMLGTALNPVNPALASNLMWAWRQSNDNLLTEDSQFVTTLAVIDPTITPVAPQLASINIPGYHSVERFNFGTPNETALWFINGDFYQPGGHRHADDGQVSIYAHSAPLAIDFNANLYSPETPGRFIHNSIVYDGELGHAWNADNASLTDADTLMQGPNPTTAPIAPANTEFAAFRNSTTSTAAFTAGDATVWSRTVRTMNFDPSYPIIYVTDAFSSGPSATLEKTLTWNLMATGAVSTPAGSITPTPRLSAGCQSPAGALPSNGTVASLTAGLNHFNFTGVTWPAHATQGINWDLYMIPSDATTQFFIGNWGHGCQSNREANEFHAANNAGFTEVQDILRVHDTGPFTTVILPYRKTETPTRTITQTGCGTQISQTTATGTEITCFNGSMAMYAGIRSRILTVYDTSTQSAFGFQVSGGTQEVSVQSDQILWTISGFTSGIRNITLPGNWYPNPAGGVTRSGNTWSYNFTGGQQTAPVTITFSQLPLP